MPCLPCRVLGTERPVADRPFCLRKQLPRSSTPGNWSNFVHRLRGWHLSLSLSLLRAKWKGKEEFEDGCYFNERDPRVERRIVSLRIESFRIEKFVIGLWVLKKYLSTSDSEWIFIRSRDDRYCAERFIIPEEIKIASTKKKNLKNLEKILIQTRISIHTTFLDTRVME